MPPLPHIFTDVKLEKVIYDATLKLLHAIQDGDLDTYHELVAHDVTAFEPEAGEHQVHGLDFHRFYFDLAHPGSGQKAIIAPTSAADGPTQVLYAPETSPPTTTVSFPTQPPPIQQITIASPHIRILSPDRTSALITYIRVTQKLVDASKGAAGVQVSTSQETRVWEYDKKDGVWRNVHFHRSVVPPPSRPPVHVGRGGGKRECQACGRDRGSNAKL
ncbi:uncharacterized protein EV422DRAFT_254989 [Fimicolochytrium jonesii]|uniref:uncharacterized protein n=1 Tax=Fimicolochytrium jonesii TaxID=1396493 RepID=UPI0022FE21F1|nr:uncharacterized protein EV422DRAFT_254989 [Fimicolochytrium jonesii]KAI8825322.1 hypothetical protein EV422DRAFT_254989 [Fimicolochytrium jonesii]